jgi:hypothetical protein
MLTTSSGQNSIPRLESQCPTSYARSESRLTGIMRGVSINHGGTAHCRRDWIQSHTSAVFKSTGSKRDPDRPDHRSYTLAHGSSSCLAELLRVRLGSATLPLYHFTHPDSRVLGKRLDPTSVFLSHQVLDECASHVHTGRDSRSGPELAIDRPSCVSGPVDVGIGGLEC